MFDEKLIEFAICKPCRGSVFVKMVFSEHYYFVSLIRNSLVKFSKFPGKKK